MSLLVNVPYSIWGIAKGIIEVRRYLRERRLSNLEHQDYDRRLQALEYRSKEILRKLHLPEILLEEKGNHHTTFSDELRKIKETQQHDTRTELKTEEWKKLSFDMKLTELENKMVEIEDETRRLRGWVGGNTTLAPTSHLVRPVVPGRTHRTNSLVQPASTWLNASPGHPYGTNVRPLIPGEPGWTNVPFQPTSTPYYTNPEQPNGTNVRPPISGQTDWTNLLSQQISNPLNANPGHPCRTNMGSFVPSQAPGMTMPLHATLTPLNASPGQTHGTNMRFQPTSTPLNTNLGQAHWEPPVPSQTNGTNMQSTYSLPPFFDSYCRAVKAAEEARK